VCESNFVKRDIIQFLGTPEDRIAVVPAPPISQLRNSASDERAVEAIRTKYKLPLRYVFYAAQFWPHKNHMRLVEAFGLLAREHADCALVLTGKQRDEFDRVFHRVRELGLEGRVRHIGYVEQADLAALYRAATVVAVPTLFESISIPVYEAFSLGTAVCASNVVGLPEQIGEAGLLFDPLSTQDIAEKIGALLADPGLRATLVARGHERMASVTHDQYAAQLRSIIDAVCVPASAKPA
jgi:glycosyltransferase involved in cell wall biosynthesis